MTYDKDYLVFQPLPTHPLFVNLTGQIFGRLTIVGYGGRRLSRKQVWVCRCECGVVKPITQSALHSGQLSCGCLRDEKIGALNRTHGLANTHPLYLTWCNMRRRCYDPKYPKYLTYGPRGIKVCKRWRESFPHFLEDMGEKPSTDLSIERVDNNLHYSCGHCEECTANQWTANCIWATPETQGNNTRSNHLLTFNGKTQTIAQWAREVGISYGCLIGRINKGGWGIEKALTTPAHNTTAS